MSVVEGPQIKTHNVWIEAALIVERASCEPMMCAELVAVMNLKAGVRGPLMAKLVIAATLMIGLGYPGEVSADATPRAVWGLLSTLPFLYILYALWSELARASSSESTKVKVLLRNTRLLLLGTWGFYPIAYLMPLLGLSGSNAFVSLQVGYSFADILAKCGYGLMIYSIARAKMEDQGEVAESVTLRTA